MIKKNILRFANISSIKIINLLLDQYVVKNDIVMKNDSLSLQLIIKKYQKKNMNIDGNIRSKIFSYLYKKTTNEIIITKSCLIIDKFMDFSNNNKVSPKLLSLQCWHTIIKIVNTTDNIKIIFINLELIRKYVTLLCSDQKYHKVELSMFIESLFLIIKNNTKEISVVKDGLYLVKTILNVMHNMKMEYNIICDGRCLEILKKIDFSNILLPTLLIYNNDSEIISYGLDVINILYKCHSVNVETIYNLFKPENIISFHDRTALCHYNDDRIISKLNIIMKWII